VDNPIFFFTRNQVPDALEQVISACKQQIEIAPLLAEKHKKEYPKFDLGMHEGYNRYTILLEKNRNYLEAIKLCEEAKQQGWKGDWDARIKRCTRRLGKADSRIL